MPFLDDAISELVDNAIEGLTPSAAMDIYSSVDHNTATYVRSATSWPAIAGIDLTPLSVYNSFGGQSYGVTAVHERFGVTAHHIDSDGSDWVGTSVRFVAADNTVVTRVINAYVQVVSDLALVRFSAALPATISIAKVLPTTWPSYLPRLYWTTVPGSAQWHLPAVWTDQHKDAHITLVYAEGLEGAGTVRGIDAENFSDSVLSASQHTPPQTINPDYEDYTDAPVAGDSGNGTCFCIDGQLVLLCEINGGNAEGTALAGNRTLVNAAMDALVSGASLTSIDLSGYSIPLPHESVHWTSLSRAGDWVADARN